MSNSSDPSWKLPAGARCPPQVLAARGLERICRSIGDVPCPQFIFRHFDSRKFEDRPKNVTPTHPVHGHLDAAGLRTAGLDVAVIAVDIVAVGAGRVGLRKASRGRRRAKRGRRAAVEASWPSASLLKKTAGHWRQNVERQNVERQNVKQQERRNIEVQIVDITNCLTYYEMYLVYEKSGNPDLN
jgi:hypothetical protein